MLANKLRKPRRPARKVEVYERLARKVVGNIRDWREMTVFTCQKANMKRYEVNPELLALAIAHEAWKQWKTNSIVILNTNHIESEVALELIDEFENPPSTFEFGTGSSSINLLPKIKISFERLKTQGKILGQIIKSVAPDKNHKISEYQFEKVESISELSELLIETLKPPSISDILENKLRENKNKGKLVTVAQAVGFIGGLIFQPLAVAPTGLKVVQEIVKTIKTGKEELYKEWEKALKEGFNVETVKQICDFRGMQPLVEGLKERGWAVILNTTPETIYEPLSLYMIWNAIETTAREMGEALGVLADSDNLVQIPKAGDAIRRLVEQDRSIRLAYIFRLRSKFNTESTRTIKSYLNDRVVIFNIPTRMLLDLFETDCATSTSTLLNMLYQVAKAAKYEEIAFTYRNYGSKGSWKLEKIPIEEGLKARLRRFVLKLIDMLNI